MRQWRLIYDKPLSGAENMARDEAILSAVACGQQPPTLRIYAWRPFCLSLGYAQKSHDIDFTRIEARGFDVVRRPTGGRAILHGDELTYSLCLPIDHEFAQGDVLSSYRQISLGLIDALEHLGLHVASEKQDRQALRNSGAVCFEIPSHYEITVAGKKLIGSAQVRRKEGILQHGTLPLCGDVARICDVLTYADETERIASAEYVRNRATTLEQALGHPIDDHTARHAFVEGFTRAFQIVWLEQALSPAETEHAHILQSTQYADQAWTLKR